MFCCMYKGLGDWIPAKGVGVNNFTTSLNTKRWLFAGKISLSCSHWPLGEKQGLEMSHQTELLIQACDSPALWCKVTYIVVSHECVLFIMHAPSFFSSVSICAQQHWSITIMVLVMMRPWFHLYPSPFPSLTGLTLNNTKKRDSFFIECVSGKFRKA